MSGEPTRWDFDDEDPEDVAPRGQMTLPWFAVLLMFGAACWWVIIKVAAWILENVPMGSPL